MKKNSKRILIVDDSEIDRTVLKNILQEEFEIIEADSGYSGLDIILKEKDSLDAFLLDVSMPVLDGFGVLGILKEKTISVPPVFLITAEATRDNVQRAIQYNVSEFIRKPFDREDILKRIKLRLGIISECELRPEDVKMTQRYISDLKQIYNTYLYDKGEDTGHCLRIQNIMRILLEKYALMTEDAALDKNNIEIISSAGYFCNIGRMAVSENPLKAAKRESAPQSHTMLGAAIIQLNYSQQCSYFVQICSDICMHHHERYDGTGFPHRIIGENNLIYTQMCRLAERFDTIFSESPEQNEKQFDLSVKEIKKDEGFVSEELLTLLISCKWDIIYSYHQAR